MVDRGGPDRRRHIRAKRIITVRHRLFKRNKRKNIQNWQLSTSENMSVSGLLFVSAFEYRKDDVVEVHAVMSGVLDIFKGYGKVIRVQEKKGYSLVAIEYVDLKAKSRSAKSILSPSRPAPRKAVRKSKSSLD